MIQKRLIFLGLSYWGGIGIPASVLVLVGSIVMSAGMVVIAASVMLALSLAAGGLAWGWDQNHHLSNPDPLWQKTLKPKKMDDEDFIKFREWEALGKPEYKELH